MPALIMDTQEADESFISVADLLHVCAKKNIQYSLLSESESMGSEKHISVDPFSLRESANSKLMIPVLPPLHPPTKPKFLSYSLPNSASSSPKFSTMLPKKKSKNLNQVASLSVNPFFHRDSIALTNLERLRASHLRRSKSCGEGRTSAPPEDFDLKWVAKSNSVKHDHQSNNKNYMYTAEPNLEHKKSYSAEKATDSVDENFKCGALCLFLPGFGKGAKPVRARKEEPAEMVHIQGPENLALLVSKRVSLEKFECGSWRSSAILDDAESQKDASNLFYDLPLEMIRCSASDTDSPVTAAFVFDKDRKGVLKKNSSRTASKKSPDSSRHVRFSTSSPTSYPASPTSCVTDDVRLHKAREDLNSFLEAQTA
ncbi:uncharacterized protein LOC113782074 [Coffea eugenioides]|uniref:uncharacterized protein LOC113782074 n=1 Tax=Coffea eugenioides TaxID=49369 RepID=UPI000F608653|nr:uncharacterized protein LOC113782074 [Coffea eugenioides]